jgi:NAD(P)-dependent dehydrogenase (short-subunit alcohol dehydrogenase family)
MPVVLITGANRSLGFEFARQYVADGWQVFGTCGNPASAAEPQRLAKSSSGKLAIVAMDVTDSESVREAALQLDEAAVDVVINCAGITGVSGQRTGKVDYGSWARVVDVNTCVS